MNVVRVVLLTFGLFVLSVAWIGCKSPTDADPEPAGGGQKFVLDRATFDSNVAPILTAQGCDNGACHGGGIRGTFQLSPDTDKDFDLDFEQASLQVSGHDPASSPLLLKPLDESGGGDPHAGGAAFAYTSDADYQAILAWIVAGEFR